MSRALPRDLKGFVRALLQPRQLGAHCVFVCGVLGMRIRSFLVALTGALMSCTVCLAAEFQQIEYTPPEIDYDVISRLWVFVKRSTHAPIDLPPPRLVLDWHVPPFARMGFQYPTEKYPEYPMQISIAPRTIEQYSKEMVTWGVGHELVHYAFILRENQWRRGQATFQDQLKHHCNPEFKDLTRAIADEIWKIYHSDTQRAAMYDEVEKSCFNEPNQ